MGDEAIADVPVGLLDHVGKENGLDLIHEEDLRDSLKNLIDGIAEGDMAAACNRPEYGNHGSYLAT